MLAIGIIGCGRFGAFLARQLLHHAATIRVWDINNTSIPEDLGEWYCHTLEEICTCDIVIPAVPISAFEATLARIAPLIASTTIVMDVCSVKIRPCESMLRVLPPKTPIIATHPMFGPDSVAASGLAGKVLVAWPVRASDEQFAYFEARVAASGIDVVTIAPDEHDRIAAESQLLTHLFCKIAHQLGMRENRISTQSHRMLMGALALVGNDSFALLRDMVAYNPYAERVLADFQRQSADLLVKLRST